MSKVIIALSASLIHPDVQILLNKKAKLQEKMDALDAEIKEAKKASLVPREYSKEFLILVNGKRFTKSGAKDAWVEGKKAKATLRVQVDGKSYVVAKNLSGRGGAKNYLSGYGYATYAAKDKFKDIFGKTHSVVGFQKN
jgi:hypothetical protein